MGEEIGDWAGTDLSEKYLEAMATVSRRFLYTNAIEVVSRIAYNRVRHVGKGRRRGRAAMRQLTTQDWKVLSIMRIQMLLNFSPNQYPGDGT